MVAPAERWRTASLCRMAGQRVGNSQATDVTGVIIYEKKIILIYDKTRMEERSYAKIKSRPRADYANR